MRGVAEVEPFLDLPRMTQVIYPKIRLLIQKIYPKLRLSTQMPLPAHLTGTTPVDTTALLLPDRRGGGPTPAAPGVDARECAGTMMGRARRCIYTHPHTRVLITQTYNT